MSANLISNATAEGGLVVLNPIPGGLQEARNRAGWASEAIPY